MIVLNSQKAEAEKKWEVQIEELLHDERVAERRRNEELEKQEQYQLHTVSSSAQCIHLMVLIQLGV